MDGFYLVRPTTSSGRGGPAECAQCSNNTWIFGGSTTVQAESDCSSKYTETETIHLGKFVMFFK